MRFEILTVATLSVLSVGPLHAYNGFCKWPDEHPGKLTVGLRVGAAHSRIGSLTSVLESGEKKPTYTWEKGLDTTTNKYFSKIVLHNTKSVERGT